jgi:hypothetical protein
MKVNHVSASSISSFKACPIRYRLGYVEALREAVEPQPLRLGTAWHKGLEVLETPDGAMIGELGDAEEVFIGDDNRLTLAVEAATAVYTTVPDWADPTEWAVEREIVANALAAYHWLYGSAASEYETVATELSFDLPLVNPETGHPTPTFRRVGKIDRIIRHKATGRLMIQENKSTSKSIDSGSTYWDRLRKDTQSKFYICAARDLQEESRKQGMDADDANIVSVSGLLHDVFHKPQISPKKLTMAETAAFMETGDYCGQKFDVVYHSPKQLGFDDPTLIGAVYVDTVKAEREAGATPKPKKDGTQAPTPFAIRETPGMFGARLFQDMTTRPEFYFARREIAFTDAELEDFRYQVWALQRTMAEMELTGHWYENEQQCEATFKCCYCPICYNNVDVYHGQTPPGFKRIRTEEAEQTQAGGTE